DESDTTYPEPENDPDYEVLIQEESRNLKLPELFGQELNPGAYRYSTPEIDNNPLEAFIEDADFFAEHGAASGQENETPEPGPPLGEQIGESFSFQAEFMEESGNDDASGSECSG
ncbi:MAG: hypothetical protein WD601_06640, partial [Pseudohongiellaceae bacterium]